VRAVSNDNLFMKATLGRAHRAHVPAVADIAVVIFLPKSHSLSELHDIVLLVDVTRRVSIVAEGVGTCFRIRDLAQSGRNNTEQGIAGKDGFLHKKQREIKTS
jgi:hypothetical protein